MVKTVNPRNFLLHIWPSSGYALDICNIKYYIIKPTEQIK